MPLQLEERDLRLLAEIGELGLLDSETIRRRYWRDTKSPRACQNRLKLLADQNLLKSVTLEVTIHSKPLKRKATGAAAYGGRRPTVYALTDAGADAVEAYSGSRPPRVSHSDPKALTLFHRLGVIKVRLAIDDAARLEGIPVPPWILEQDARPATTHNEPLARRLVLHEIFPVGGRRPDASCLLRLPSTASSRRFDDLIAYFEIDRSTTTTGREEAKLSGYHSMLKDEAFRRHWPQAEQPKVRLFYVCQSTERVENLREAFAGHPVSRQHIRFAVLADLVPERALTDAIWQTIDGELLSILPPKK